MKAPTVSKGETLLTLLIAQLLEAAAYNPDDVAAPATILWPDKGREWEPLLPMLRATLPQLFTLGTWVASTRTGPAVWIKCAIAGSLPDASAPTGTVPLLYLPGVGLKDLRAIEECPRELQPLAELQYRGRVWTQPNGRDWSLLAFLTAGDALGLDVARDGATAEAMRRSLLKLAYVPLPELTGRRLDSYDFDAITNGEGDSIRTVLRWIDNTATLDSSADPNGWAAFRNICKKEYGFDPAQDGRLGAAERLGNRDGKWRKVWERFFEAPTLYSNLPDALRQARPQGNADLFASTTRGSWPQDNEHEEEVLRGELLKLEHAKPGDVCPRVEALEKEHAERREWVWSALGKGPLADALRHLHVLAAVVANPVFGTSRDEMAEAYRSGAWRADAAVIDALCAVRENDDVKAVRSVVRALYIPWLEQAAYRLQEFALKEPFPTRVAAVHPDTVPVGTVVLFVDGLRFDIGERLRAMMVTRDWTVQAGWRWSALPSVTPTAKPAVSPVADLLRGDYMAQEFCPNVGTSGKPLSTYLFRTLLAQNGVPYLSLDDTGDPAGKAWTELGDLDGYGHEQGWKLAWRVGEVLDELQARIAQLFAAGWKTVRIVTDHGWLLVPGGLPKTELPGFVADAKWARCAAIKAGATPEVPMVSWYWEPQIHVAVAPGASSFVANAEYAHGGISLQECVTPVFTVRSGTASVRNVSISEVKWLGLKCRITASGDVAGCSVDLRTFAANPKSSIADKPKHMHGPGDVSLFVADDSLEGGAAQVVILDDTGAIIARRPTTVGDQ